MANIALVVLDTLRKDAFDEHFGWLTGEHFENAWSTSHWTVPAHASLFTGRLPSDVGVYARTPTLGCDDPVLAERLSTAGFRTRGLSTNRFITPNFGFDRGFDEFECRRGALGNSERLVDWSDLLSGPRRTLPVEAVGVFGRALRGEVDLAQSVALAAQHLANDHPSLPDPTTKSAEAALSYVRDVEFGTDEFLFLNLMDVHSPYNPPRRYQSRPYSGSEIRNDGMVTFTEQSEPPSRQAYDDAAAYLSDVLADIHDELSDFDYVVTLSDHGESFGENGVWGHPRGLHPEVTHVPLVVSGPDVPTKTCRTPVDLLDVYVTLCEAAGLSAEKRGRSLLDDVEPRPCLTEYHGLTTTGRLEVLLERGIDDARVEALDRPCFGAALPPDYYGYESLDGFVSAGEADTANPRDVLESLATDRRSLDRSGTGVDDGVRSQLQRLGYL